MAKSDDTAISISRKKYPQKKNQTSFAVAPGDEPKGRMLGFRPSLSLEAEINAAVKRSGKTLASWLRCAAEAYLQHTSAGALKDVDLEGKTELVGLGDGDLGTGLEKPATPKVVKPQAGGHYGGGLRMTEPSSNAIQRLTEAIAASREVTDRQIAALNAVVERTSQNVDRAAVQMQQSASQMQQSAARIEHQVGLMSEHLTALDIKIERLTDKIDALADRIHELTSAVNGHLRIAEKQADNIAELTKLVAAQANTVAALISRNA